jgi:TetR/AcrR family transcriptional regulator, transcriptional repressor of bet genes
MARASNTTQRRSEIVKALQTVIASHGYERATIQLIAAQAGLSPGLIHYHYRDKREILIALIGVLGDYVRERYLRAAEGALDAKARLRAYIDARLGVGRGAQPDAVAAWVAVGAEAIRQPEIREVYQDAIAAELRLMRELVGDYLEGERKSREAAARLSAVLMAFIEGAFLLSTAARRVMPKGYAAEAAMQVVERFAAGEPDAAPAAPT